MTSDPESTTEKLLKDLLIAQLARAGCTNEEIRGATKVNNNQVSAIAKPIRAAQKRAVKEGQND